MLKKEFSVFKKVILLLPFVFLLILSLFIHSPIYAFNPEPDFTK